MAVYWRQVTDNLTTVIISITILLYGLRTISGAPTIDQINPFNKQPPNRRGKSAPENQLQLFLDNFNFEFSREIKRLYKSTENLKFIARCPNIRKLLQSIKNAPSYASASLAIYETLLQFASFLDKLENTPIRTEGEFDFYKRRHIFIKARAYLKLLIIEFEDTFKKRPNRKHFPAINMDCLPEQMDHSEAHFMDIDFFKKLKKILRESRNALKANRGRTHLKKNRNQRIRKLKNL